MGKKEGIEAIYAKPKRILVSPSFFFKSLNEENIWKALAFALSLSVLAAVLNLIFFNPALTDLLSTFILFSLFLTFIMGAALYLSFKLLGIKSDYAQAYQVATYSMTLYFLLGWIQSGGWTAFSIISLVILCSTVFLEKVGLQQAYRLRKNAAISAIAIQFIIIIALVVLINILFA